MTHSRSTLLTCLLTSLAVLVAPATAPVAWAGKAARAAEAAVEHADVDPAFAKMLGSAAPASRLASLAAMLRAVSVPSAAAPVAADLPVFAVLHDAGTAAEPRYEASGVELSLRPGIAGPIRLAGARLALMPSPDGRSCRFELSASPFGEGASMQVGGTVEWATGPAGGDKVNLTFRLDRASVDAMRTWLPERFDASFGGLLSASGNASGYVGEETTEDAPASPLRGEFETKLDWTILGRTAPVTLVGAFSIDDRMVRVKDGRLAWQGLETDLNGWFDPHGHGKYELAAGFKDVDTSQVATDWGVAPEWRPEASLSGTITMGGKLGEGLLRYVASAPSIHVPVYGGRPVTLTDTKLEGSLLAINADVSVSTHAASAAIGDLALPRVLFGLQWWRSGLTLTSSNMAIWGGKYGGSLAYKPETDPAWVQSGSLVQADAKQVAANLAPWLALDIDGTTAVTYVVGQDKDRRPRFSAHASLVSGRLGGGDLGASLFAALAAADPALAVAGVTALLLPPKTGAGTRVDRLFFELAPRGEDFDLGMISLKSGPLVFEGDGTLARSGDLRVEATAALSAEAADKLVAAAPWLASLRGAGGPLYVPVTIGGKATAPLLAVSPGYADLLARAKRGEAVEAPGFHRSRHVGEDNMATIPGDPSAPAAL